MTDTPTPDEPRTLTEVRAWVLSLSLALEERHEKTMNALDALDERIATLEDRLSTPTSEAAE